MRGGDKKEQPGTAYPAILSPVRLMVTKVRTCVNPMIACQKASRDVRPLVIQTIQSLLSLFTLRTLRAMRADMLRAYEIDTEFIWQQQTIVAHLKIDSSHQPDPKLTT